MIMFINDDDDKLDDLRTHLAAPENYRVQDTRLFPTMSVICQTLVS
jgi:hypothetical protein